ncbi:MAG: DUF4115 domain-containing protein [Hylemonella sp.]|nr:DUF4115 domain-containing protein [Hylemonella sp.]
MSEEQDKAVESADSAQVQEAPRQPTAGEMLRAARETAGLSLSELAAFLKVNAKKLEALETDQHDLLPNAVFVRGLASSVCRALKIDATPVLAQLPQTAAPSLLKDQGRNLNAPFRTPADLAQVSVWDQLSRPMVLAVLALLAAALVMILLPSVARKSTPETTVESTDAPAPTVASPTTPELPPGTSNSEIVTAAPPVVAPTVVAVSGKPNAGVAVPPSNVAAPVSTPTSSAPPKPVSPEGALVYFKVSGSSWIEVTDAEGSIRLSRLLQEGESARASGALPLTVVIGNADVTEVQVRGKSFSLEPVSRNNVARFEVK